MRTLHCYRWQRFVSARTRAQSRQRRGQQDHPPTEPCRCRENGDRRSALHGYSLERAACKKSDRPAIGRPKGHQGVVGPNQRARRERIERTQPEHRSSRLIRRDECELSSIRGKRSPACAGRSTYSAAWTEEGLLWRVDLKTHDLWRRRFVQQAVRQSAGERCGEQRPGDPLAIQKT